MAKLTLTKADGTKVVPVARAQVTIPASDGYADLVLRFVLRSDRAVLKSVRTTAGWTDYSVYGQMVPTSPLDGAALDRALRRRYPTGVVALTAR